MKRRLNFQTISWFWDMYKRSLMGLNPPYQRRSVWTQDFRDHFIDTILLGYPSPTIFLYEEIEPSGKATYNVVDGKQRLITIFDFAEDKYPISEIAERINLRGKYFSQLDSDEKVAYWNYEIPVEYLPTNDENIINNIFNRLNRNVAKLTPQELRHAQFDGLFIKSAEQLSELFSALPQNFPRIDQRSRRQMKDIEFTAQLLLLLEEGPKSYSQDNLDNAFSNRDIYWDQQDEMETQFRDVIRVLKEVANYESNGTFIVKSRLRNQADFYSLFGALSDLIKKGELPLIDDIVTRLTAFIENVDDEQKRSSDDTAKSYYEAARAASNDIGARTKRIEIMKNIISNNQNL